LVLIIETGILAKMRIKILSLIISVSLLGNPFLMTAYSASGVQSRNEQITLGNRYAKIGHDAYSMKEYLKSAQNYEKAYQITKASVYIDNAIAAYTSYSYELANNKQYEEAIKYCSKILSLKPNNQDTKEALSDIYFTRGADYFYTGDVDKAKADLTASLKYGVNKDQLDRAKDGLAKIEEAKKNNYTPVPKYQGADDTSIPDIVGKMETKIYGSQNTTSTLLDRINKLEKEVLGQNYPSDGLIVRVDRIKRAVLPEYAAQVQSAQGYSSDNYIREIMEQSMGKVSIFGKMPIHVYVDIDHTPKSYKKYYFDAVKDGFKEWENISEGRIKFEIINDPSRADICVAWSEDFEDFPWQPTLTKDDVSAEKERNKYRKAGTMVQVGSVLAMLAGSLVPPIGIAGMVGSSVASPYLQYKGMEINKISPDIKIPVNPVEGLAEDAAKAKLKQIAIHQMGHALGIRGHSNDPNDMMYANFTATQLSQRDINTIKEIYKPKDSDDKKSNSKQK
jgi:predicted Zn-dependent protease